jgi:hypothetical protein
MRLAWKCVCHPGRQKASIGDLRSVRVKKSFRNDEIGDSKAGCRFIRRIRPDIDFPV